MDPGVIDLGLKDHGSRVSGLTEVLRAEDAEEGREAPPLPPPPDPPRDELAFPNSRTREDDEEVVDAAARAEEDKVDEGRGGGVGLPSPFSPLDLSLSPFAPASRAPPLEPEVGRASEEEAARGVGGVGGAVGRASADDDAEEEGRSSSPPPLPSPAGFLALCAPPPSESPNSFLREEGASSMASALPPPSPLFFASDSAFSFATDSAYAPANTLPAPPLLPPPPPGARRRRQRRRTWSRGPAC